MEYYQVFLETVRVTIIRDMLECNVVAYINNSKNCIKKTMPHWVYDPKFVTWKKDNPSAMINDIGYIVTTTKKFKL